MTKRKIEPVSFNLDDPFEQRLHNYAKKHTFSTYVKRLIQRDMEGGQPANNMITMAGHEYLERTYIEATAEERQPEATAAPVPEPQHQEPQQQPEDEDGDVSGFI